MRKYIDAEQMKYQIRHYGISDDNHDDEEREGIMCKMVDDLPAADVQEIKHGKWKYDSGDVGYANYLCSECDNFLSFDEDIDLYPYCPYCGAKMEVNNE